MKIATSHLGYCTNIHPGESWPEVFENLRGALLDVRRSVAPEEDFGIGLRLSALAAAQLESPESLGELRAWLAQHGLYVFTMNGFPYGAFHGTAVKDAVYQPDWTRAERSEYTERLVRLLRQLLRPGEMGSISTVPGGFKAHLRDPRQHELVADRLHAQAAQLIRLHREQNIEIVLALEPEPGCLLETTQETVEFFEQHLLCPNRLRSLATRLGQTPSQSEAGLRRHLGVCLDTCHAAVEFETPHETVKQLRDHAIRIAKVQLSAGLRIPFPDAAARERLQQFDEPVYLHQTVARLPSGQLLHFNDLPQAFADSDARTADEWRVHFHVPLHLEQLDGFVNTQPWLAELLRLHVRDPVSPHLEVETYTWSVLPQEYQGGSLVESLSKELRWVRENL